ncbi:ftsJ-like methyltransferase family protein [Mycobacterium ulcerans str. Harvey]|uniref:FtsJ-like methyltransferase family protein n=1 Tax=Mycobacterium ulcerans str. Harvey TaxID=1299332 RepID=A0ABN0R274_MYCUL|nr:ftsJ-like methyltransferase family protein [Mycobacterium ulcerans str. Harvey]
MARRTRVDAELVRRGLARSRQQAAELISAGKVRIDGLPAVKPATAVAATAALTVAADSERGWVSRGAHKLIGALDAFGIDVHGRRCLDAGASTGGSPRCCWTAAPPRWSPPTSGTASLRGHCERIRG